MRWGCYSDMGLTRGCTQKEADAAWRQLSRRLHPDAAQAEGATGEELAESNRRFAKLTEARGFVGTAQARRRYDAWLDAFCLRCVGCGGKGFKQGLSGGVVLRRPCAECSGHGAVPAVELERNGRA